MDTKNVIPFPKQYKSNRVNLSQTETKTRYDLEQRKVLVSASLVSIILAVSFANRMMFREAEMISANSRNHVAHEQRSLASIDGISPMEAIHRNTPWETSVAQDLAKVDGRKPSSLGRTPTVEEKLRFGFLEGKYMVRFEDGKLQAIEFSGASVEESPKYLNGARSFLEGHRDLMPVDFHGVLLSNKKILPTKVLETYDLVDQEKTVGRADFELDVYGRLLTFRVQKSSLLPSER